MHLAFITPYDPTDVRTWSGIPFHMSRAMERQGLRLSTVGPLREWHVLRHKVKQLQHRIRDRRHLRLYEPAVLRGFAEQVQARLAELRPDVVFSVGSLPLAYLDTDRPVAFWSDATFASVLYGYQEFTRLSDESVRQGHRMEQAALGRTTLALYAAEWAAQTAVDFYGADPARVEVVPMGANLTFDYTPADVEAFVAERPATPCRLLFIGVEWLRKGGDIALRVTERLNEQGIPAELVVVGCQPIHHEPLPPFVRVEGFVDKSTGAGRERLRTLLRQSHFLILPTRAEAYGIVFCEGNASALPCIASDAGGVPTIVRDGVNGQKFAREAAIQVYCDWIAETYTDRDRYRDLCRSSFSEYQTRLNWDVAAQRVKTLLKGLL